MKPKRTLSAYILLVGVLGLSIVGGVVAYQVVKAMTKTQITSEQEQLIKPIDGSIDTKVTENLFSRKKFSVSELGTAISVAPTEIVSVTPTPSQVASSAASIQP